MNAYKVSVEPASADARQRLEFEFTCHEDLAELVAKVSDKGLFDGDENTAFVVGLKLFSGVLLKHRGEPLFADFAPHFGALMKKLKAQE